MQHQGVTMTNDTNATSSDSDYNEDDAYNDPTLIILVCASLVCLVIISAVIFSIFNLVNSRSSEVDGMVLTQRTSRSERRTTQTEQNNVLFTQEEAHLCPEFTLNASSIVSGLDECRQLHVREGYQNGTACSRNQEFNKNGLDYCADSRGYREKSNNDNVNKCRSSLQGNDDEEAIYVNTAVVANESAYDYPRQNQNLAQDPCIYDYPKPSQTSTHDPPIYDYPKPSQDISHDPSIYDYPKPSQHPAHDPSIYDYPKPSQDLAHDPSIYDYPKPSQSPTKDPSIYDYPKPSQSPAQDPSIYDYPKLSPNVARHSSLYDYPLKHESRRPDPDIENLWVDSAPAGAAAATATPPRPPKPS